MVAGVEPDDLLDLGLHLGVIGETDGGSVFVGNAAMLERIGCQPDDGIKQSVNEWEANGRTVAYFGRNGNLDRKSVV